MSKRWDMLGMGAVAVDDLIYVDRYPPVDSKIRAQSRKRQGGGLVGTALVAAARLGVKAAYYGILGNNELSDYTLRELEREGVDCSAVQMQKTAEPFYSTIIVVEPTAQRTVLSCAAGVVPLQAQDVSVDLITQARVLLIDHSVVEAGLRAVEIAREHHIPVVADIEADRHPKVYDLIPKIDHLIIGIKFARQLTEKTTSEKMVEALAQSGRACSVVTAGKQGCWYAEKKGAVHHFPAFSVEAMDTTGCGDVFHGAYTAALAKGEPVRRCIQIASAAAALKATQPGGRSGIPNWESVEELIQST